MAAPSKLHFYRALCSRIGITVIGGRSQKTLVVKTLTRCLASRAREAQHRRPHAPSARSSAAGGATDGYSNDDFQPLKIPLLRRTDEEDGRHGNAPARVPKRREPPERLPDDVRQWRRLVAEFERRQENVRDLNERNMRAWVADTVTPLHRLPYIEQLAAKRGKNMDALSKVARILGDDSVLDLLEEVKPSAYERYIRDSSLPACHLVTDGGFWRDIVVRSNQSGNLMAIIVVHPGNVERERLEAEKEKLSEFFRNGDGQECEIDSLYVQEWHGVDNVEFLCGRADDVLQHLASDLAARDVVAVVNPSRAGLAPRAVRALRGCPSVRRVVYVSCHPEGGAARDIVNLCHPRPRDDRLTGAPFRMRRAVPVDMFPHTLHCELVLELER
ncbi:PREDICTED: tRNA (uracil(54)-C(5))-methyltransferase homolog [Priapulus caudatus]|uniref:tRNA (Uracil(54)-C(5))-methyltransferase homolog n=1 Tax=Priapulus caudatus TaxID=37621 RepID=A0ABM1F2F5_PRICU|nr:PREDICTED: tRNA (uracil(54)-C(5))-methyltransferase homolog [Priapulus caudatus]